MGALSTLAVLVAAVVLGGMALLYGVEEQTMRRFLEDGENDGEDDDALAGCTIEKVGCFTVRCSGSLDIRTAMPRARAVLPRTVLRPLTSLLCLHRTAVTGRSAEVYSTAWTDVRVRAPRPHPPLVPRAISPASRTSFAASTASSG